MQMKSKSNLPRIINFASVHPESLMTGRSLVIKTRSTSRKGHLNSTRTVVVETLKLSVYKIIIMINEPDLGYETTKTSFARVSK